MRPKLLTGFLVLNFCFSFLSLSQGIHQSELKAHRFTGPDDAAYYESLPYDTLPPQPKQLCNLNKIVYGWHPYWIGSAYNNYQWDLLSHLSFFSYEVDPATGNATSTHGWATSSAVTTALAQGKKVTLCVTLFSGHSTFLGNATSRQTLISNLINLVSTRGAHGVNIDFEGLPSSQATTFANFMVDLANQMHAAIPNSEVSTVLYSVDWNNVFNFSIMEPEVDHYIIMGYDYYYSGSTTAGPNDPLYQFGTSYNYTLSRSITDYLKAGCPKNKLVLGLPNYGREWSTTSLSVPSSTTASGVSRTYSYIRNNSTGFYTASNHSYEAASETDMYLFMNGSTPKQCFISKEGGWSERLDHVLQSGIAGIGIWALGYDDGYLELWNTIESKMTDCYQTPCSDTIHDFGGPLKNYYNNENYTWTVAPPGATSLTINFSQFDVEANYDYLYIYDGSSTSASQIPGSPFTGITSPGTFTTSTGAVTFRFTSDLSTTKPGFFATYTCNTDNQQPETAIQVPGQWQTNDFTCTFLDTDNDVIQNRFALVADHDGVLWSGNRNLGYLYEDFSGPLNIQWTTGLGTWSLQSGKLSQSSETETNTACNTTLAQSNSGKVVYHWKGRIGGSGTNRRAGIHFFCSDLSLPNRGDSYLVYWRVDSDKCQIYRSTADNLVLQTNDDVIVDPNVEYDFKILYDPSTGVISAYLNNVLSSSWTDPSPIQSGMGLSVRSGNCTFETDDIRTYLSRGATLPITIGTSADMVRYQNTDPNSPSCSLFSLVQDASELFSTVAVQTVNIDWTAPVSFVTNDGYSADVDVFVTPDQVTANWTASADQHSSVNYYEFAVGTSPGSQDVLTFTNVGVNNTYTATGLSLTYGQLYYCSVKAVNGAGLTTVVTTDGQMLQTPTNPPIANFSVSNLAVCAGDSIQLLNTSTDGTSFLWISDQGTITGPANQNTWLIPLNSGVYQVSLTAFNSAGSNTITQYLSVTVLPGPVASGSADQYQVTLPNAVVLFSNNSQNSDAYYWDFGDGESSTDVSPWHLFSSSGTYVVMMVASQSGCQNDTTYLTIEVGNAGLTDNDTQENSTLVFPNPFTDQLTISSKGMELIEILDMNGRLVGRHSFMEPVNEFGINGSQLTDGLYFLNIRFQGTQKTFRVIKSGY